MKQEFSKIKKLLKFGIGVKSQIVFSVIFLVAGSLMEIFPVFGSEYMGIDVGAIFLLCSVMFPAQLIMSLGMSQWVQASPYKKKFQTSIPAKMTTFGNVIMFAWSVLLQVISTAMHGKTLADAANHLLLIGIWAFLILIFTGVCYKFFLLSMVVLYAITFLIGMFGGIGMRFLVPQGFFHPVAVIVIDLALILLGGLIQYGISMALYHVPLSKIAFGAAMRRSQG